MDTPVRKGPGQKLSAVDRLDVIRETHELLSSGVSSIRSIARELNVSQETAAEYKKLALHLMARESPGRENIRMLQFNRLGAKAEEVAQLIKQATYDRNHGKQISLQSLAALHNTYRAYIETMDRITGLNIEVTFNAGVRPPLTIIFPSDSQNSVE